MFSVPANPLALARFPCPDQSIELGRFVLLDEVPDNGETFFLGRAFELLRREHIEGVLSFSDPMPRATAKGEPVFIGHVGTIYQAHNAIYTGQSRPENRRLLPDGSVLHNRALAKIRALERGWRYAVDALIASGAPPPAPGEDPRLWVERVLSPLVRVVKHPGNHRYVWGLTRAVKRHLGASRPYPKLTAA